jgi:hypothetical protein
LVINSCITIHRIVIGSFRAKVWTMFRGRSENAEYRRKAKELKDLWRCDQAGGATLNSPWRSKSSLCCAKIAAFEGCVEERRF